MNKAPLEKEEQRVLVKWLRRRGYFVYAIPNHKEMKQVEGAMAGIPDLQICLEGGKVIWIEMKRTKGGRVDIEQHKRHAELRALGHTVFVAKGAKEASEMILNSDMFSI